MSFINGIISRAQADRKRIVLTESEDSRIREAAAYLSTEGIADIILLGSEQEIKDASPDLDFSKVTIFDPQTSDKLQSYEDKLVELRQHRGMIAEKAKETMKDKQYYGVMMVKQGDADGMVAGAINSTANTLRPALQILKTAPGTKLVSAFFIMELQPDDDNGIEHNMMIFSDCGLNENPDPEQLSEIAVSSGRSYKLWTGEEPKVALLSYSTMGSADSDLTKKVVEATKLAKEKEPEMPIDGELQLDAAIIPSVAKLKAPDSSVAGHANTLIFPDLNSGNIGYKLVNRFAGANAYGPILQGIAMPVNDLSRGCSLDDIIGVVALTAVQAQEQA